MDLSIETVGTGIGVILGVGTIAAGVYRYWGLPERMARVEAALEENAKKAEAAAQAATKTGQQGLTDLTTKTQTDISTLQTTVASRVTEVLESHHKSRAELFTKLNDLQQQVTANKLEATTAMATAREIQNGIKEKFQSFERVEASISAALLANAEKKAEIERLKDDYRRLDDLTQQLNREIGELRTHQALESRDGIRESSRETRKRT